MLVYILCEIQATDDAVYGGFRSSADDSLCPNSETNLGNELFRLKDTTLMTDMNRLEGEWIMDYDR